MGRSVPHSLDISVLTLGADTLDRALATVPDWANVVLSDGIPGDIGEARYQSLTSCTSEYVALLDEDDELVDGGLDACMDVLTANPDLVGVYTDCDYVHDGEVWKRHIKREWSPTAPFESGLVHHLVVYRNEVMQQHIETARPWKFGQLPILAFAMGGPFQRVPVVGYLWHRDREPKYPEWIKRGKEWMASAGLSNTPGV